MRIRFAKGTIGVDVPPDATHVAGGTEDSRVVFFDASGNPISAFESESEGSQTWASALPRESVEKAVAAAGRGQRFNVQSVHDDLGGSVEDWYRARNEWEKAEGLSRREALLVGVIWSGLQPLR